MHKPNEVVIVMACENTENLGLERAKHEEMKSWKNSGVYEEVPNTVWGQKTVSSMGNNKKGKQ